MNTSTAILAAGAGVGVLFLMSTKKAAALSPSQAAKLKTAQAQAKLKAQQQGNSTNAALLNLIAKLTGNQQQKPQASSSGGGKPSGGGSSGGLGGGGRSAGGGAAAPRPSCCDKEVTCIFGPCGALCCGDSKILTSCTEPDIEACLNPCLIAPNGLPCGLFTSCNDQPQFGGQTGELCQVGVPCGPCCFCSQCGDGCCGSGCC